MVASFALSFKDTAAAVLRGGGVLQGERARLLRCTRDVAARWDRLQELRFTRARLWAVLQAERRLAHLPAIPLALSVWPIFLFIPGPGGIPRLVERPIIHGGTDGWIGPFVRFSTDTVPEAVVLRVEGEIDISSSGLLANAVAAAYESNRPVIVDLSRLDYLDGSGVRILEQASHASRGRFVVVGSKPTVHRIFDVLGLTQMLPVVPCLEAAREYLRLQ